jgi:hypothetical protein
MLLAICLRCYNGSGTNGQRSHEIIQRGLNMKTNLESEIAIVKLWRQLYQTYTLLKQCEDRVIEEHGLTTEQFAVLGAMDYFAGPMNITDIAHWLERSTNSVTMLVLRLSGRSCCNYHMRTGITFLVCWGRQNMRY